MPLGDLADSVVGSRPLNKQPFLIAGSLEDELLNQGWPAGRRIGGEAVLAERYGVGRDVFREVVRLLEARDHARMRRGPHGGLEVVLPDLGELIARLAGYAYVSDMDRSSIIETWILLQSVGIRLIDGVQDIDRQHLGRVLQEACPLGARAVGEAIIAASGNRMLAVLGDLIGALLPPFADEGLPAGAGSMIAQAASGFEMLDWIRTVQRASLVSQLDTHPSDRKVAPPSIPQSSCFKGQAMQLVHDLMSATTPERWTKGELIGNEFDLADRMGVDKSIVRQAIRLMEDAETATALPGRGRGLVTRSPSTAPLSRLLCAYFVAHGGTVADGESLFVALRIECVGAAAERTDAEDRVTLLAMTRELDELKAPLPVSTLQEYERLQQRAAHNDLLGLSIDGVKAFLTWKMPSCPVVSADVLYTYCTHTRRVVTAICEGDRMAAIEAEATKLKELPQQP
ncbi:hypothetical protein ASE49_16040 [Novosphingobium sp. Leaf2]|nr:hypothetical protein ASE49_16040 [Novosphingobium sp. Leaf2]